MPSMDIVPARSRYAQAKAGRRQQPKKIIKSRSPRDYHIPYKPLAVVFSVSLILFILLFVFLPEAQITVKARTEPVTRDFEIKVEQTRAEPSGTDLVVPAKVTEREFAGEKKAVSTGSKNVGKTASGFVSIYNFSKTTLILRAGTTVLTANGRRYVFTQDVGSIRPTARIGLTDQEIDESSLIPPVPIIAAAPGEEFNMPKSARLEIQNEAFGSQPTLLYAIVAEDISGGSTRQVKLVTQADIDSAQRVLSEELLARARTEIKSLDNAISMQVAEHASIEAAGTETPEFTVNQKIKVRALTFDDSQVKAMIVERMSRLLPESKTLQNSAESFSMKFASVNLDAGVGILVAHFQGQIVYKLDERELLEKVRGKTGEEIREIFLSKPEISSLSVQFSPFWVKKAPKLRGKTTITVETPAS